jgi:hypothetical protein
MRSKSILFIVVLGLVAVVFSGSPAGAGTAHQETATVPVTTVVTVLGPNFSAPPSVAKQDVNVYSNKARQDVISWVPAQGDKAGLQLAIVIDNADSPSALGPHFSDFKDFITSQPPTTQVGLYYAMNGSASPAAEFSSDHEAVAQKLRLPLGRLAGDSPSVYLSLQDLVSHWPANGMRHEIILIASGVDRLDPGLNSPYVDAAIDKVQKSGAVVYTIYTGGPHLASASLHTDIAWRNLVRISEGSGGNDFFQGFETPVNFVPIFRQVNAALANQYWLTFSTARSQNKKGDLRPIEIRTEQHNLRLSYPSNVFVPGP